MNQRKQADVSSLRLRPDLAELPSYAPGKAAPARPDASPVYKVSANENPYPPLPSVLASVAEQLGSFNRYPASSAPEITALLCERYRIDAATLVLGSGSVEIVTQMIQATAGAGDEVVFAWRSFEAYPLLIRAAGAVPVPVPLDAHYRHDLDAMLAAITDRTRLVIVCNPNNPTGTTIGRDELERFLDSVPSDITVLIDEAYEHFNLREDSPKGIDAFRSYDNVSVAHTFSKAYGLAGLRIGYAIAPERLAQAMRKVALPFGVTALAQQAAVASLAAEAELQARVDVLVAERERLLTALDAQGWQLTETQANFIWFPLGDATAEAAAVFEAHGLIVRPYPGEGLRVTIDVEDANDLVLVTAARLVELGLDNGLVAAAA